MKLPLIRARKPQDERKYALPHQVQESLDEVPPMAGFRFLLAAIAIQLRKWLKSKV